jgi:flagellar biogenesis protein FliO
MIWLIAYGLKRSGLDKRLRGVSGQKGRLTMIDVLYLDPKRKVVLMQVDAHEYLILLSGDQAQLLDKRERMEAAHASS